MYLNKLLSIHRDVGPTRVQFNGPEYEGRTAVHRYHFTIHNRKSGLELCTAILGALHSETIGDLLYAFRNTGAGLASTAIRFHGPKPPPTPEAARLVVDAMLWMTDQFQDLKDEWTRDSQKLEARRDEMARTSRSLKEALTEHRAAKAAHTQIKNRLQ